LECQTNVQEIPMTSSSDTADYAPSLDTAQGVPIPEGDSFPFVAEVQNLAGAAQASRVTYLHSKFSDSLQIRQRHPP
jgi:hypothetical protein